jgi:uncharacterized protein YjdB
VRTDVREVLVQHGTAAAREHPAQVDRGVRTGSRRFWRRLLLVNVAVAVAALVLSLVLGRGAAELVVPEPTPPQLTGITVTPSGAQLFPGETRQLRVVGAYDNDSQRILTTEASWRSSDPRVATVVLGTVRAHKPGRARITAHVTGVPVSSMRVRVRRPKVKLTGIAVIPGSSAAIPGDHIRLAAWGVYSDGTSEDITGEVTWASRDPGVAEVDVRGLATAHAPGNAWIGATLKSEHGHVVLKVGKRSAVLTTITIEPTALQIRVGEGKPLHATGSYDDDATRDLTDVEWSSDAEEVATVDVTGLVTGISAGSATITATVGDLERTVDVTVVATPVLGSITITPSAPDLCLPAKTVAMTVEARYDDGTTADVTRQVQWTPRDEKVATVDGEGKVIRTGPGSTSITATFDGKTDTVKVAACATATPSATTEKPTPPPSGTAPGPGVRE